MLDKGPRLQVWLHYQVPIDLGVAGAIYTELEGT